jgi:hypothetical protein
VYYLNYLGNPIASDARCTREIKPWIAMTKDIQQREDSFYQQTGLKSTEEPNKMPHLQHSSLC